MKRKRGPGFDQKRAGLEGGGGAGGGKGQFVHVNYKSFRGDKSYGFGTSLLLEGGGGGAGGGACGAA